MKLTTTIDVTLGRGQNMREHYRVRANRVKAEREAVKTALARHFVGHISWAMDNESNGARITLHRPWARVPLDSDNLSGAFKGVRDEVASFLGVDDRSERLHWIYTQSKQPKGTVPTVVIEVMPVGDIDPQVKRVRELEECLRGLLKLYHADISGSDQLEDARRLLAPTIGGVPVIVDDTLPDSIGAIIHTRSST